MGAVVSARSPRAFGLSEILATPGSLSARLQAYREAMQIEDPVYISEYDRLVARIAAGCLGDTAPKIGDPIPSFLLPDPDGHFLGLEHLLETGPVVLSFNRGHWCPFCRIELDALASAADAVLAHGGRIVSIMPDRAGYTRPLTATLRHRISILSDIGNGYALEAGVVIFVGEKIQEIMADDDVNLDRVHGDSAWFMPFPATFVIGRDGRVVDRHIDPDFRTRMEVDRILATLARLDR